MFRLYDPRTGQAEPVLPARPGLLHAFLAGPAAQGRTSLDDLRTALLADLIRRVAERHHLRVVVWETASIPPDTLAARAGLNIHPAQPSPHLPEPLDIGIAPAMAALPAGASPARWLRTAAVQPQAGNGSAPGSQAAAQAFLPAGLTDCGLDPLALRLALLRKGYREPAGVDSGAIGSAGQSLRRWREQVAGWAQSPSKPMSARYVGEVNEAFGNDLDTPSALRAMQALADDREIPAGSKFEAFAYLDQLLGLDLAREVGR